MTQTDSTRPPLTDSPARWAFALLALALPWTIAPMGIAAALTAALTIPLWWRAGRFEWPRTPVDLPAIGWALALVLATLFAVDRSSSAARLGKALFPALVALASWHAARERDGRRAIALLLFSAGAAAAFGLVLFALHRGGIHARARGAVGHYITFAGQLMLFLSLAAGVAVYARTWRWRAGALAVALLAAPALAATFTRGAWVGAAAGLSAMLALARPRWIPALAAALVITFVLAPAPYRSRLASIVNPADPTNRERTLMWEAGGRMFRDHPLTGVGLMDLKPIYEKYRSPDAQEKVGHLHSVPVQIAATTGAVGILGFTTLVIALMIATTRGLRESLARGGLTAGIRLGVTGGLIAFLVAGLFEWNFGDEELLYPLYVLVGISWAARKWGSPSPGGGVRGELLPSGASIATKLLGARPGALPPDSARAGDAS